MSSSARAAITNADLDIPLVIANLFLRRPRTPRHHRVVRPTGLANVSGKCRLVLCRRLRESAMHAPIALMVGGGSLEGEPSRTGCPIISSTHRVQVAVG